MTSTHRQTTALRWTLGLGVAAMVAIGLVLLFLLAQATNNREMYEQNYQRLFVVNVAVAALLLVAILWIAVRLYFRLRQGRFGSRLLVRLAAVFALAGFAPADKLNREFERPLRCRKEGVLVESQGIVEQAYLRNRRLTDADGSDFVGFDQRDVKAAFKEMRHRGGDHPAGRPATSDYDP